MVTIYGENGRDKKWRLDIELHDFRLAKCPQLTEKPSTPHQPQSVPPPGVSVTIQVSICTPPSFSTRHNHRLTLPPIASNTGLLPWRFQQRHVACIRRRRGALPVVVRGWCMHLLTPATFGDPEVSGWEMAEVSRKSCRGKWGKADYLRNSMQYFLTECLYLTKDFSRG